MRDWRRRNEAEEKKVSPALNNAAGRRLVGREHRSTCLDTRCGHSGSVPSEHPDTDTQMFSR